MTKMMRMRYSALVVRHGDRLMRTSFRHGKMLADLFEIARSFGWTPVAVVYVTKENLPKERVIGLVDIR